MLWYLTCSTWLFFENLYCVEGYRNEHYKFFIIHLYMLQLYKLRLAIKFQNSLEDANGTNMFFPVAFSSRFGFLVCWDVQVHQLSLRDICFQDNSASGEMNSTLANSKGNLTPPLPSTLWVLTGLCPLMLHCKMKMPNLYSQISTYKTLSQLPNRCFLEAFYSFQQNNIICCPVHLAHPIIWLHVSHPLRYWLKGTIKLFLVL